MDAKLNHSDLSALFAQKANISGNKAETFTKAVFDLIIEGLEKEGIVKINGLGTFKIADVASRSSVNVNTGEKFEIRGHKKLTFTPAESLKESVNQPFAMFEPVEVDDSYQEEDENKEYDNDLEALTAEEPEVPQAEVKEEVPAVIEEPFSTPITEIEEEMPAEEEATVAVPAPQPVIEEEMPAEEEEPVTTEKEATKPAAAPQPAMEEKTPTIKEVAVTEDETITEPVPAKEEVTEPIPAQQTEITEEKPAVEEKPVATEEEATKPVATEEETTKPVATTSEPQKENAAPVKKEKKGSKAPFIILLIIAVAAIGSYIFFSGEKGSENIAGTVATVPAEEKHTPATESPAEEVAVLAQPIEEEPYEFVMTEELAAINLRDITLADTTLYISSGELTTHIVAADETLTKIALKYFGDKKLWPYIVKYNNLAKPDDLCKGMEIIIPKLKPTK